MSQKKSSPTITEKQAKLDELVAWFSSDEFAIEQAMERFAEAEKLADEIRAELDDYSNQITVLKQRFDQEV